MPTFVHHQNDPQNQKKSGISRSNVGTGRPVSRQDPMLRLQRAIGNQAVLRMLQTDREEIDKHSTIARAIQTKLAVSQPGDAYEQEADHVADTVLEMPSPVEDDLLPLGHKKQAEEELQRTISNENSEISALLVHEVLRSPGQPLHPVTRAFFEPRFGYNLSNIRIHTDEKAAESARAVNALAYTVGRDVVFAAGQYAPQTSEGRRLMAHELTHVVQQQGAAAMGSSRGVIQRQGRGERGKEEGREEGRNTRTTRAKEDDNRRGRPEGGEERRDRRSDPTSDFESDWAGRAILERYLSGEGDWNIVDSPSWTAYMENSNLLRAQLKTRVITAARTVSSIRGLDGVFPISETFHAELENGEGIVGYQYLHGTNKDAGDFLITGDATVQHIYGETRADTLEEIEPGTLIEMRLRYVWNDKIDPNPQYGTDTIKSIFAEIITLGEAEAYRIAITWSEDCRIWIPETGPLSVTGYPEK